MLIGNPRRAQPQDLVLTYFHLRQCKVTGYSLTYHHMRQLQLHEIHSLVGKTPFSCGQNPDVV